MNLSSSEDEEEIGLGASRNPLEYSQCRNTEKNSAASHSEDIDSFASSFSDIEWEDVSVNEKDDEFSESNFVFNSTQNVSRSLPSKDVMVHFDDNEHDFNSTQPQGTFKQRSKKRKECSKNLLPNVDSFFLLDLHRANLLALLARSIFLSSAMGSIIDDTDLWCLAFSCIPIEFHSTNGKNSRVNSFSPDMKIVPDIELVQKFCEWFFNFSANEYPTPTTRGRSSTRRIRRRRPMTQPRTLIQGSIANSNILLNDPVITVRDALVYRLKEILIYLSDRITHMHDEELFEEGTSHLPLFISPIEKLLVFVCMTR